MKQEYYSWHQEEPGFMDVVEPFLTAHTVLDLGCGSGWVGKKVREHNPPVRVVGLDIDRAGLTEAKDAELPVLGDAGRLPFRSGAFDGAVLKDLLEHSPDALRVMTEIHRVLKPGGTIYVSVPDVKSKTFWDDYTHIRPFNLRSLKSLLEDSGYSLQRTWYTSSWPGLGIAMRIAGVNRLPRIVRLLARLGIKRQNIVAVGHK
jgi:ubiquinone/menaquinone biosynthesis C-methylase UbiE